MTNRCRQLYSLWVLAGLILFLLFLSGCNRDQQQAEINRISPTAPPDGDSSDELPGKTILSRIEPEEKEDTLDTSSPAASAGTGSAGKGHSTPECYDLQPAGSQQKKVKSRRCEPQSLSFARCRSEINSCRLGVE